MRKLLTVFGAIAIIIIVSSVFANPEKKTEDSGTKTEVVNKDANDYQSKALKGINTFLEYSGFTNATPKHLVMLLIGLFFIFLAIRFNYEPLLLIPIGVGILIGIFLFIRQRALICNLAFMKREA